MKVAVIGSRSFNDIKQMKAVLDKIQGVTAIISGGAPGADRLAEDYARGKGIRPIILKAEWNRVDHPEAVVKIKFGRRYDANAGFRRNRSIVEQADLIVAFWDGKSPGTKNALDYAKAMKKKIEVYSFAQQERGIDFAPL